MLSKKQRFKRRIIQPVFGVKMTKEAIRKSILVEEAVFNDFSQKRDILGLNSTELLQTLLQEEIERTTTLKVEKGTDFDNLVKQMTKKGSD